LSPYAESAQVDPVEAESEPLFQPLGRALRKYWRSVVLVSVVAAGAALGVSLLQQKRYSATAILLIQDPALATGLVGNPAISSTYDPARQAATNAQLVSLHSVADLAASRFRGITGARLSHELVVSSDSSSDLVRITISDSGPRRAAELATAVATSFIGLRRGFDRSSILGARAQIQAQYAALSPSNRNSATGRDLLARADQLALYAGTQTGNAELVQRAGVPTSPSSPHPLRNSGLALLLGLMFGCVVALVRNRLDIRLRTAQELESVFHRPILGEVPELRSEQDRSMAREAFRFIRTNVRFFAIDRDVKALLVTSAEQDDGKTTVAWGLATAAAAHSERCLFVECDFRHPVIRDRLKLPDGPGLTHVLVGTADLESAINSTQAHELGAESDRTIDVLGAGAIPPNPTELLGSSRMVDLIHELRARYDLVILDVPPLAVVVDAAPLVGQVDAVVVVSRLNKSRRDASQRLRTQLANMRADFIGVVANCVPGRRDRYGYGSPSHSSAHDTMSDEAPGAELGTPIELPQSTRR
jgi:polysaccharide biosynthesis transport protein